MAKDIFDVVLLLALPASGKSEVRNFMANIDPEILKKDFHIGQNVQLDDFPYVFLMRRIDDELQDMGEKRIFYPGDEPFYDGRDWGTLTELLNEDYQDLIDKKEIKVDSAAEWLFDRFDRAAKVAGIEPRLAKLQPEVREKLKKAVEKDARKLLNDKLNEYPDTLDDKTVIIELARGGPHGSTLPLKDTFGYQYTLPKFSDDILKKASILYIWVTPEESRRKNAERNDPKNPGSILNHGVPIGVMLGDYGNDDMMYLKRVSDVKDTITIDRGNGHKIFIPIGTFDNRIDKTSFLRGPKETWDEAKVKEMTEAVKEATDMMYTNFKKVN